MNPFLNPRKIANILFDEFHSESWTISKARASELQPDRPENSSYEIAATALELREFKTRRNINSEINDALLEDVDTLVFAHPCLSEIESTTSQNSPQLSSDEINSIERFVGRGGGLVIITEYENQKYGSNLNDLTSRFGIAIEPFATVTDRVAGINEEKTHVLINTAPSEDNLLIGVDSACFYRAGSCKVSGSARPLISASSTAKPKQAVLVAVAEYGNGRVVVINDSDLFGDEYIAKNDHLQLWLNLFYWASEAAFGRMNSIFNQSDSIKDSKEWKDLKLAIEGLREVHSQRRQTDNSYKVESSGSEKISALIAVIKASIAGLKAYFTYDGEYLDRLILDFDKWAKGGFAKPDFSASLGAFHPERFRKENIEHLVVFPLYTPNHSLDIYFEALLVRIPWHDWLARLENEKFSNSKFVPGHLIDFTSGYESECAVLFPETVSVEGDASNNFGVIFCDREAQRYQICVSQCAEILGLNVPPDIACFFKSLPLISDMFAAWDLVHDTLHSKGPLPFDPFMIRQLSPYWMYGLEELRVDLGSVCAGIDLAAAGSPFAKTIAYGVLFDRIFRFAISGSRIKNYDGLGGQLLFAALHKKKAILWTDNRLTIKWHLVFNAMRSLSVELDEVYDGGADQSRVRRYVEGHKFVAKYVPPAMASKWDKPTEIHLNESDVKGWIALALDDEFPLGSFHAQLKKKFEKAEAERQKARAIASGSR